MEFKDQLNRIIKIDNTPKRIVSLVPSQTELLCDLGLEGFIVGVTKFCVHPNNIKADKEIVGGTKQVHFDKINALKPDIILCNKEENTLEMITELEKITLVHISDIISIEDCMELIAMYGIMFDCVEKGIQISEAIKHEQQVFLKEVEGNPKLKAVYFIWRDPWMVAAQNTFIDCMLTLNNFENNFNNLKRYPEITLSKTTYNDVDLVLLSSEPYPFKQIHSNELKPHFPNAKIILVDGEMFSWYGSRLIKAFPYFKQLASEILN